MEGLGFLHQAHIHPGRHRAEGGDSADDLHRKAVRLHPLMDVQVGGIDRGVSQGKKGHILSRPQTFLHRRRCPVMALFQKLLILSHGHLQAYKFLLIQGRISLLYNLVGHRLRDAGSGHRDHLALPDQPQGL